MGLERLNILFFLINATGMLPYRMMLDKKKKRFERFDIGWRHPVTWWFVVVLIIQLIYTPYITSMSVLREISASKNESVIYIMATVLWFVCYGIVKLIPTILLFRVGGFITALTDLKKVDRILDKIPNYQCSSRQRTVIGFVCGIIMIVSMQISASYQTILPVEKTEILLYFFEFFIDFITSLQLTTWLLLIHLTYYNIAHRIAILAHFLGDDQEPIRGGKKITVVPLKAITIEPDTGQLSFRLQKVDYVFDRLAKTCTINIFLLLHYFIQPNSAQNNILLYLVLLTSQIAMALVIVVSAGLPAQEVKRLRGKFLRLSTKEIDLNDEAQCAAIVMALSEERVQLSAGGLMPIGKELLPSLTATVITYLVILLQNAIHKKSIQDKGTAVNR
ncbi:hypothetical protein DAPPUDRAFT_323020 [Daphnia pulex]|uniref:Gustatory receptor n=1 Tax=Daphnia pulex TaxID=6669 RepID=E9GXP6_DAPPU|nr:hypothetical protein DAPPUDRAFT_323020 [Daphnia pulex]|eukprot:EFX75779.1 hypothetical protein DAPPUDRAFT_323020 [Daphnia pulex]